MTIKSKKKSGNSKEKSIHSKTVFEKETIL
jgi:hypothetical protein